MQSMTAILTGATLANHIGLTNYDLDAMLSFLSDALVRQRSLLVDQEHKTMATPESAKELLDQMIADLTGKHVLFTDQIAYGRGRPPDVHITDPYFNAQHMGSVWLQVADNGCIRAHKVPFDQWCMSKRKDPRHVIKLLSTDYFITTNGRKSVGAGVKDLGARTNYGEARYKVYDFIPKTFRSFGSSPDSSSPT